MGRYLWRAPIRCSTELAELLAKAIEEERPTDLLKDADGARSEKASGPSVFIANEESSSKGEIFFPQDLVLSLAALCELDKTEPGEIVVHLFPFGGLPQSLSMASALRNGDWPTHLQGASSKL
eukprot:TRINITY_DN82647_c0_g1_i1.p1 TRINITY_DN82647_c0_g1~~TRINITY_DN82647_c0_g1_i1.p1  ORF type:complete len:123 (+),score=23.09 TRINITY_DN82647_c0_g1_i1:38-406(+)